MSIETSLREERIEGKCHPTDNTETPLKAKKKYLSQPLRIEDPDKYVLITSKTIGSRLWFANNKELEERILGFLAMNVEKYKVELYGFQLMGNHYHLLAKFPEGKMSHFMRDLNSKISNSVKLLVPNFDEGPVFKRRFSSQYITEEETLEKYFFYCGLQPVRHRLCKSEEDYPGYKFFSDAINGVVRECKYFAYGEYKRAKLKDPSVKKENYWKRFKLKYSLLPKYSGLSKEDYRELLKKKYEGKRNELIDRYKSEGLGFCNREELLRVEPGDYPKDVKKGVGTRPVVLSVSSKVYRELVKWYLKICESYRAVSKKFRGGEFSVEFPKGTYRPPGICCVCST